jgi:dTDP-4-dehydrorhamnose reductase
VKVLVIGRSGQLARALARRAVAHGLSLQAIARPELDLTLPARVEAALGAQSFDVVINAAAYTAVDNAEDDRERAHMINAEAAGILAGEAARAGKPIVHVSTDYVFDGDKGAPYLEDDPTGPTGAYGASKLEGERCVLGANQRAVVLRTSWVFDAEGANFVRTMLRLAKTRDEVSVVADQRGCPTFADDLADAALTIAARPEHFGLYHCAGAGETSWAAFAEEVFAQSRARGGPAAAVRPISAADYPTRAKRPSDSRLDCAKLARDYGVRLRPWREALSACMNEIAEGGWSVE